MSTDKNAQMETSVRLRAALEAKGLSIKEAAEACGIPYRSFQNYTLGLREPNAEALGTISSRLGISVDWLLTGDGRMLRGVSVGEAPGGAENPREQALLALWRELDEGEQREIQLAAEEKKRLKILEQRLAELEAVVADVKRLA
ncbi:TPA: helix-turn-helix domain-containing protein [Pseudomonas aeruginosa]|uniref:helix-turn-helix domain-containing protein n=1 Tax=Pseudomonas TaxID=286 RepID=UPI001CF70FB7|nr:MULTISPECIES: helix-turn-helix domain-containing protein [Pseudomonas]MCC0260963.1 helix-turn-helix domain-containing protein [Pseudomonas aeruginosa]MCS7719400.1 helix-turn-helix domain-containing protein [Pseudomonas aeruginosa]MCS8049578.1 helix-turn-helix domain-containing protein [Pseudomonas aeruginosa]MCS9165690.1 helix-turn-helix domain-containing protein [Pseudomonas aeruginosa]MCS9529011.1 helix-turn-helix domain-containing protein [Pseudomonas aeruginosa]